MHRGEIVKERIKNSGIAVGVVAEKLNLSRRTLYNKFKETTIPYSLILQIGDVIHHDFSQEFPHLAGKVKKELKQPAPVVTNLQLPFDGEQPEPAKNRTLQECEAELLNLQRKYIALLEKFNELLLRTSETEKR
ncbi:hypothetical protein [Botryobacter ruber]|uniref:hypothetical protein n=1 Tax=Botryobacter ruber TaxID=2171629 RepID=UPI000E0BD586|nr:hypothetical protein [Botryobacter ruber]